MRVLRTILGMLLLTIGLPSLLAGTALWAAMQHRDPGGAFSGELQRLSTPGYAFVVPDVDRLLRTDAPFTRVGDTQLRINARTQDGPAFVGLAPSAAVDEYLLGVPHSTVRTVDIGTGALPVATIVQPGRLAPRLLPTQESFWLRFAADGHLAWTPGEVRGGPYSLVVMSAGAKPDLQLTSSAELRPGWLNSSTWGLLTLGTLLLMVGLIVLAWPTRRREVVYVVEPSQVPDLMAAIGAPLPLNHLVAARPAGAHRPRTLADAQKALPAPPPTWPPAGVPALAAAPSPEEYAAATAIPPGAPLSFIKPTSVGGAVSLPLGDRPSKAEPMFGRRAERVGGRRRPPEPSDLPLFQASAVGAWVAETAAERARETEATAAARMAEAARQRAGADPRTRDAGESPDPSDRSPAPRRRPSPYGGPPVDVDAVAAAYAAGAADARAARGGPEAPPRTGTPMPAAAPTSSAGPMSAGAPSTVPIPVGAPSAAPISAGPSAAAPVSARAPLSVPIPAGAPSAAPISAAPAAAPVSAGKSSVASNRAGAPSVGLISAAGPAGAPVSAGKSSAESNRAGVPSASPISAGPSAAAPVSAGAPSGASIQVGAPAAGPIPVGAPSAAPVSAEVSSGGSIPAGPPAACAGFGGGAFGCLDPGGCVRGRADSGGSVFGCAGPRGCPF